MVTFVLDASAILRFFDGEAGVVRVKEIFRSALRDECKVVVSAVNWGEVIGKLHLRHSPEIATNRSNRLLRKRLEVTFQQRQNELRAPPYSK
jgi:PIN domain nuclease of toxin-antitoxin system